MPALSPGPAAYPSSGTYPSVTTTTPITTGTSVLTGLYVLTGQGDAPLWRVQVAFNDVSEAAVWTDITEYVRSIDFQTGRNFELDQFQAGTASIVLSTNDGRFSPENGASPYAGSLVPLRRVRVLAEWDGGAYSLWAGFVEAWEPSQNEGGKDLVTVMRAADAFKMLRYAVVNGAYAAAYSGLRIASVLNGLPGVSVVLTSDGTIVTQAETYTNQNALSAAQDAAATEAGFLYCDALGNVRFDDRQYRVRNETTNRIIFGDASGEKPYTDAEYSYSDEALYTEVRITAQGGTEQVASDTAGQARYGRRTYAETINAQVSLSNATPNDAWARGLADYFLSRYQTPTIRLDELTCSPASDPTMWGAVLGAPLGGRLLVRQRPAWAQAGASAYLTSTSKMTGTDVLTGTAGMLERAVFIESIKMSIRPSVSRWTVTYGLSNADNLSYWILGSSLYSILGRTTRLAVAS